MAQGNSLHSGPAGVSRSLEAASTLMAVTPGNFLHYLAFPTYITCHVKIGHLFLQVEAALEIAAEQVPRASGRATEWQGAQALC